METQQEVSAHMRNNRSIGAFALGILTGSAITGGIILATPAAHADNTTGAERVVCAMIDFDPTINGVTNTATELITQAGVTAFEAGQIIAKSVTDQCPEHLPLLKAYVAHYGAAQDKTA